MEEHVSRTFLKEDIKEFDSIFSTLVSDLTSNGPDLHSTNLWLEKVLRYNVPHGKKNRGLMVAMAYRYFAKDIEKENVRLSFVLGWCVEILQASFLVFDDLMDGSKTRRGKPCWHLVDNVGKSTAINDAILLEQSVYKILCKYFHDKSYYTQLIDLLHGISFKTACGQSLDSHTACEKAVETYSFDLYRSIVKYKTSFYSFYLPVALAITMVGLKPQSIIFKEAESILLEIGHYYQVQDDFLDCFGNSQITGKLGTDISDGKCTWLVVTFLKLADPEQKKQLLANYGKLDNSQSVERVKMLFNEVQVQARYVKYEEMTFNMILTRIQRMPQGSPLQILLEILLKTIYQRKT